MLNKCLPIALMCGLLIAAASVLSAAESKTIVLKDGRKLTGEITKTTDGYQVKTKFGVIAVASDQVDSITSAPSEDTEYEQKLAKIDATNPQDHYDLAEWAFKKGLNDIARKELKAALDLKPDFEKATLLLRQIEKTTPTSGATTTTDTSNKITVKAEYLVSDEDILRIRIAEIRPTDTVVIEFKNKAIDKFIERNKGKSGFDEPKWPDKFRGMSNGEKVNLMLKTEPDNMEMRNDIVVKSDPKFMLDFRNKVWPAVTQYCANTNCHGSEKGAGGMKLFNVNVRNDKVDYTNYVIIDGFVKGGKRMIDRDHPDLSLLLQYGLPKDAAQYTHPKVNGQFNTMCTSKTAANYTAIVAWIETLKAAPHPVYNLKYQPPFGMKLIFEAAPDLPTGTDKPKTPDDNKAPF